MINLLFGPAVQGGIAVTELDLSNNGMFPASGKSVASLLGNATIRKLNLAGNPLGHAVSDLDFSGITDLDLGSVGLTDSALKNVASALQRNELANLRLQARRKSGYGDIESDAGSFLDFAGFPARTTRNRLNPDSPTPERLVRRGTCWASSVGSPSRRPWRGTRASGPSTSSTASSARRVRRRCSRGKSRVATCNQLLQFIFTIQATPWLGSFRAVASALK